MIYPNETGIINFPPQNLDIIFHLNYNQVIINILRGYYGRQENGND
jgi:hypothetical protein